MAAHESFLSKLHEMQAKTLLDVLSKGYMVIGTTTDPDTGDESEIRQPLTPAFFQAVSKFLKDNDITCAPEPGGDLDKIDQERKARLAERNSRREKRHAMSATKSDLLEAGGSPLDGLNTEFMQ